MADALNLHLMLDNAALRKPSVWNSARERGYWVVVEDVEDEG
jgi:hypothetical protein